jgi:hypothetical protein
VVKLGSELLATFAAVVLGLLIASAKDSYDKTNDEITQTPTKVAQFDRDLVHYGPETKETRNLLHDAFAFAIEPTFSEKGSEEKLNNPDRRARVAQLQAKLLELAPRTEPQRSLQANALKLINELAEMHWLVIIQGDGMTPMPSLVMLVLWLAIIFAGFGLVTAKYATVVVILLV